MTLLRPAPVSTKLFTWASEGRLLVTEASTLDANGVAPGRVWNDACDVGMTLVSERTGKEVIVAEDYIVRDADGDIQYWVYRPVDAATPKFTVHVFND